MNKRVKFLGLDVLFSIALTIIAVACSLFQCIGLTPALENEFFDPYIDMRFNAFSYAGGVLIYAGFLLYYFKWFLRIKYTDYPLRHAGVVIMHFMISFVFCFAMFIALIFASLVFIGFDKNLVPDFLAFITVFIWPIATFLLMNAALIVYLVKTKHETKGPDEEDKKNTKKTKDK